MKLCTDCKFYQQGKDEQHDICLHNKAERGGVRSSSQYPCFAMRSGICGRDADLFEPSETLLVKWEQELERDQDIEARQERKADRAEARADFDFERDCGARP